MDLWEDVWQELGPLALQTDLAGSPVPVEVPLGRQDAQQQHCSVIDRCYLHHHGDFHWTLRHSGQRAGHLGGQAEPQPADHHLLFHCLSSPG
uniref:Macaca fascicularis brain cDNA clone: QorA-12682, similar to human adenosine A3 receptor (ADORA3), mRNA, RefSeq: NM_000677.2 n=1 Tax=Macaca fascicularis TaxID=9541 RepID=I7GK50_MACFA|nr:unnamed protein product [Macaca fascicularis]